MLGRVLLVGTTALEDSEYLSFTELYKSQRNYNFKAWACLSEAPGTLKLVMLKWYNLLDLYGLTVQPDLFAGNKPTFEQKVLHKPSTVHTAKAWTGITVKTPFLKDMTEDKLCKRRWPKRGEVVELSEMPTLWLRATTFNNFYFQNHV